MAEQLESEVICWAISAAGITGDNFVVSGIVDWKPDLSTTWSLACYPQHKCQGGNPAKLFNDIAAGGLVTNRCIDYSWCLTNELCNGDALKHFQENKTGGDPSKVNMSELVPPCGCYYGDKEHYLFKIDKNPKSVYIGAQGVTKDNVAMLMKKQIYTQGPIMGGFIVFKNFMKGAFSQSNGGVYFERGNYSGTEVTFSDAQANSSQYVGSHAVAIIGWGVEKNILYDNGKKGDVPYWYCRNSWKDTWGDNGYFKMAAYPFNKISQFENLSKIQTPQGPISAGGMVFITASQKPELQTMKQLEASFVKAKKVHEDTYYQASGGPDGTVGGGAGNGNGSTNYLGKLMAYGIPVALLILLVWMMYKSRARIQKWFQGLRHTSTRVVPPSPLPSPLPSPPSPPVPPPLVTSSPVVQAPPPLPPMPAPPVTIQPTSDGRIPHYRV